MGFWSSARQAERPKGGNVLQVYRVGPNRNDIEFFRDKARAYYLEKPAEFESSWDFDLHRGSVRYFVSDDRPCYRIHRNQKEACTELYSGGVQKVVTLRWRGKGDESGLAAKPRGHYFHRDNEEFEWTDCCYMTRTDLICKRLTTQETVAYFRSVLSTPFKLGKLELQPEVDEGLEEMLVATFIAYREWSLRRQECMSSDDWFNPSVNRNEISV